MLFQTAVAQRYQSTVPSSMELKGVNITFSHKERILDRNGHDVCYHLLKEGRADVIFAGGGE